MIAPILCTAEVIPKIFSYHHGSVKQLDKKEQQGPTVVEKTLLNVMWQPGWEGSLGENGCMYPPAVHLKLSQY